MHSHSHLGSLEPDDNYSLLHPEKGPFPSVFLWATKSAFSIQYLFDGSLCFLSAGKLSYSQCSYFKDKTNYLLKKSLSLQAPIPRGSDRNVN